MKSQNIFLFSFFFRKKKRFNRANSSNSDAGFFPKGDRGNIHLVDGPLSPPSITKSAFMNDYGKIVSLASYFIVWSMF